MEKSREILHIEILRIIAIFFVIFNHTGADVFFLFSEYKPEQIQYWIYLFMSISCKFSVPVFFAISGALLLRKEIGESYKEIAIKRIGKIVITLPFLRAFYPN